MYSGKRPITDEERELEMKTIRYDTIGAHYAGVTIHPQLQAKTLGMTVIGYEFVGIADCAMMLVVNVPDELPDYMEYTTYKLANYSHLYRKAKITKLLK